MSNKIPYEYLAKNVSFMDIYKKDYKRITNWFKNKVETKQDIPVCFFPITNNEYDTFLKNNIYTTKEDLFNTIDLACYPQHLPLDEKDTKDIINYRKHLIGLMGNIENLFTKDEIFGKSYTIYLYDRLWSGEQDDDYLVIHYKDGIWFVNKIDSEDIDFYKYDKF